MSDFDKEAEREKLRKKLERDERKRESTQRMSELLLQGATMTNKHCDDCGDPIFRYDGREFCPTCESGADDAGGETGADAPAETGTDPGSEADVEATDRSRNPGETRATAGGRDAPRPGDAPSESGEPTGAGGSGVGEATASRTSGASTSDATTNADETHTTAGAPTSDAAAASGPALAEEARTAGLDEARASLVRTVNRYVRAAEEADDPGRARSYLAAVREAAEALDALDR